MNRFVLAAAALLWTLPVFGADHLEPDDKYFSSYHDRVTSAFKELFEPGVLARMTVEPSFSVEYAVAVKQTDKTFTIISVSTEDQLWKYEVLKQMKAGQIAVSDDKGNDITAERIKELEASLPKNSDDVKVKRCEIPLDASVAGRAIRVWIVMLQATKAAPYDGGPDGAFYHFSAPVDGKELAGQIWSPPRESNPGRLVVIAETMRRYCQTKDASEAAALQKQVDDLAKRLGL
ncbi:MAG: hypothetical protein WCA81_08940 [Rhizomicrobium sp.]|jgi:hypothetical protein